MVRTSVVVPTLDRPGPLTACLTALARSFPGDAETIVVSDGSTCDLVPVVAPFVAPLRLRLLTTANFGPAAARNRGLAEARGQIVAFTDDDCRPRPGWLAALVAGVACAPPRAVGGTTENGLAGNAYADASQLVLNLLSKHDRQLAGHERMLPSNNFAFPAEPLRRLGGFDQRYRTAEDRELCRRWVQAGYALGRVPSAIVDHDPRMDLRGFVRRFLAYGRGAAQFHQSGSGQALHQSASFHLRLPRLAAPELARRGAVRGTAVAGLLVLWEAANLAGFLLERARPTVSVAARRAPDRVSVR